MAKKIKHLKIPARGSEFVDEWVIDQIIAIASKLDEIIEELNKPKT